MADVSLKNPVCKPEIPTVTRPKCAKSLTRPHGMSDGCHKMIISHREAVNDARGV